MPSRKLSEYEGSCQIYLDHLTPSIQRMSFSRLTPGDSGVVYQDINPAVALDRPVNRSLNVVLFGDVAQLAFAPEAARSEFFYGRREPLFAAGQDHQRTTRFSQPFGYFLSKAARPARYQRHLTRQVK
jgi:hypothetical protein